jgi:ribonuclease P protein component
VGPRQTAPVSSKRTFAALGSSGRKGASGPLRIRFLADPDGAGTVQVAYAISKRTGNAVVRNRIRRRLRAAVDVVAGEMAPGAYLVFPARGAATAPFKELIESLRLSIQAAGAEAKGER